MRDLPLTIAAVLWLTVTLVVAAGAAVFELLVAGSGAAIGALSLATFTCWLVGAGLAVGVLRRVAQLLPVTEARLVVVGVLTGLAPVTIAWAVASLPGVR